MKHIFSSFAITVALLTGLGLANDAMAKNQARSQSAGSSILPGTGSGTGNDGGASSGSDVVSSGITGSGKHVSSSSLSSLNPSSGSSETSGSRYNIQYPTKYSAQHGGGYLSTHRFKISSAKDNDSRVQTKR